MATQKPSTIEEYLAAAPPAGLPHLQRMFEILKSVAPTAEQTIKWNTPFFIQPRFLFSFSATKAHLNFAPSEQTLNHFEKELSAHQHTKNFLQIPYTVPLPEDLIRRIAAHQVKEVGARTDDSFW